MDWRGRSHPATACMDTVAHCNVYKGHVDDDKARFLNFYNDEVVHGIVCERIDASPLQVRTTSSPVKLGYRGCSTARGRTIAATWYSGMLDKVHVGRAGSAHPSVVHKPMYASTLRPALLFRATSCACARLLSMPYQINGKPMSRAHDVKRSCRVASAERMPNDVRALVVSPLHTSQLHMYERYECVYEVVSRTRHMITTQ